MARAGARNSKWWIIEFFNGICEDVECLPLGGMGCTVDADCCEGLCLEGGFCGIITD